MRPIERLYHLAEADNLPSILQHGLMSTEMLLSLVGVPEAERATLLRRHRPDSFRLSESLLIRDQRPMPPAALARSLMDGFEPADWYALLNGHVFLWPDRKRMDRQRGACGGRSQALLTFDGAALLDRFGEEAFMSLINSGNAAASRPREARTPWCRMPIGCGRDGRPANGTGHRPSSCSGVRSRFKRPI
jgi:Family of unknown function (DUF7002)